MPTRNRPEFAAQAVRYFLTQDYPNAELIVVDDGGDPADRLPADPRIRVIRSDGESRTGRPTIGALRNLGCAAALGEIIVCWDDDDWHGPTRVSDQVGPILAGAADVTGLADVEWFEPATVAGVAAHAGAAPAAAAPERPGRDDRVPPFAVAPTPLPRSLAGRGCGLPGAARSVAARGCFASTEHTATSTSGTSITTGG